MNGFDAGLLSIEQAANLYFKNNAKDVTESPNEGLSFQNILENKVSLESNDVKFSKHANERLESRNITLSEAQIDRLNQGVNRARDKSINESLVMMDDLAFIVSVKNNTVVTALLSDDDSVFTNIDGAVIV